MKIASLPRGHKPAYGAEPEWQRQIAAWRELLDECLGKPTRGRVHALRVATLRLLADIPHWLQGHEPEQKSARAGQRWSKQAEKLRKALQPVRTVDVDLAKLLALRAQLVGHGANPVRANRRCLRQLDKLARRFRQMRRSSEKDLIAELEDRRPRLRRTSLALERALAPLRLSAETATAETIRALLAALAAEFPELNEGNLHEYRMRVKAVRYQADLAARSDPGVARQAAAMGRMQVAAGEWHDLRMLARKASRELGKGSARGGLVELLEELAAESLQKALALCRRTTAQLLKAEAQKATQPRPAVLKFPPRRAEPEAAPAKKVRA